MNMLIKRLYQIKVNDSNLMLMMIVEAGVHLCGFSPICVVAFVCASDVHLMCSMCNAIVAVQLLQCNCYSAIVAVYLLQWNCRTEIVALKMF